ncbi:MAG: hypothetical protein JNK82_03340 [Myxococcaceae bacterium]|nr:hypothetical protein [Myxococcaceae bacterium]
MATRAQRFRSQAERSAPQRQKAPRRPRRDGQVDTAKKGVSATDRKAGASDTAERNRYSDRWSPARVLESSATGRPSRKSTRKGPQKAATVLTLRQRSRLASPARRKQAR